jgi:OOP family OmpA-OmpF porin
MQGANNWRVWVLAVMLGATWAAPAAAQTEDAPVVVSGVVPDEATRQAILTKVRSVFGSQRVVDQLGVSSTSAPPNWSDNVQKLISPDLKKISRGHIRVTGSQVEVLGEVESPDVATQLETGLKGKLNPTYTVSNKLMSGPPQARIDSVLQGKIVEFQVGSAVLTPTGAAVLDELVPVLRTLDGKRIQVIGHTDASGPRLPNVELSRARAAAVKDYLVAKQVPDEAIQAQGMGPDQPLVANNTPENRARNRRIEVKVLP